MKTLPALHKATPAAFLLGLSLILTGCTPDQEQYQDEQIFPAIHSTTYGQSAVALPQDVRHHHRIPRAFQNRHHPAASAELLTAGN